MPGGPARAGWTGGRPDPTGVRSEPAPGRCVQIVVLELAVLPDALQLVERLQQVDVQLPVEVIQLVLERPRQEASA